MALTNAKYYFIIKIEQVLMNHPNSRWDKPESRPATLEELLNVGKGPAAPTRTSTRFFFNEDGIIEELTDDKITTIEDTDDFQALFGNTARSTLEDLPELQGDAVQTLTCNATLVPLDGCGSTLVPLDD